MLAARTRRRVRRRGPASHLTSARSANGVDGWQVEQPAAALAPTKGRDNEQWGFEGRPCGMKSQARPLHDHLHRGRACCVPRVDGRLPSVERIGIVVAPGGQEMLLSCRSASTGTDFLPPSHIGFATSRRHFALSRSSDLRSWSAPEAATQPRRGARRSGSGQLLGALKTHGWLLIYHGVKETVAGRDSHPASGSDCSTSSSRTRRVRHLLRWAPRRRVVRRRGPTCHGVLPAG